MTTRSVRAKVAAVPEMTTPNAATMVPGAQEITSPTAAAKVAAETPPMAAAKVAAVTPHFKMIFLGMLGLTLFAIATDMVLVIAISQPSDAAKSFMDTCQQVILILVGAMAGLFGGKAV